ncbi:MAG: 4-(cytidine 5'-diphospho)-2-C-methyl-D-erythritol kinase [Alphaproteobacteria bacterium]|nr:4-(cytidine 5'-diphospho)-2-C-methyl-D-erythritol kinase [Alphaproteobacteria bacterium]
MTEGAKASRGYSERPALRAAAPAKLNLYLHVTGKREDGYHLLDSLAVFAGSHDTVAVAPAGELTLVVDGPFAPALHAAMEGDNIMLRAARALAEAAQVPPHAAITLTKNLPVAAGIGGGSADAAATLGLLARLWGTSLGEDAMDALALSLGADVPVCRFGRAAFMGGIGEKLDAAPALPPAALVLVNPNTPLATKDVFRARDQPFSQAGRFAAAPADAVALAALLRERKNDLEAPAIRLMPVVGDALAALARQKGCLLSRMSGSGATCFGLFADDGEAAEAAVEIKRAQPGWWTDASRLVTDTRTLKI